MAINPVTERILDAAAMLVQEGAVDRLSLEAVAAAADLDPGDVARRFPTLHDLVVGVAERAYRAFLDDIAAAVGDDEEPGAYLRGYIEASFPTRREADNFTAVVAGLFRSVPVDAATVASVKALEREVDCAIAADGIDPTLAGIVRLAIDGLYTGDVFGWSNVTPQQRAAVLARLRAMTRESADAPA